jgi:hypothetical protein
MRFLSIIPALLLFLSNVPVTMEMKMPEAPVMAKTEKGCCKKSESKAGTCHMKMTDAAPAKACDHQKSQKSCNQPSTSATCICTCLFQFTAPAPNILPFQASLTAIDGMYAGFLQQNYNDPHLAVPGQPPDLI